MTPINNGGYMSITHFKQLVDSEGLPKISEQHGIFHFTVGCDATFEQLDVQLNIEEQVKMAKYMLGVWGRFYQQIQQTPKE